MARECWRPSAGWLVVASVPGLAGLGLFVVLVRYFFPGDFLIPAVVIAGLCVIGGLFFTRVRVVLDRDAAEVTIANGWWSRQVPLTQVKRVDESRRFGARIDFADGTGFGFGPSRRYHWLKRLLRIRTGFEGMEPAITQAAGAARAADPERAAAQDAASRRARLAGARAGGAAQDLLRGRRRGGRAGRRLLAVQRLARPALATST